MFIFRGAFAIALAPLPMAISTSQIRARATILAHSAGNATAPPICSMLLKLMDGNVPAAFPAVEDLDHHIVRPGVMAVEAEGNHGIGGGMGCKVPDIRRHEKGSGPCTAAFSGLLQSRKRHPQPFA